MPAKFFPGIKSKMGRWSYYSVQLAMKDLNEIHFAHQMEQFGGALSEAIQREITESRGKQIVQYLMKQPDRFFNSIVIAGFGGKAEWYPVSLNEDPRVSLIADDEMMGSFGILKMSAATKYYALDGQHRLLAIKSIIDPLGDYYNDRPTGFEDEKLSVVLVVPEEVDEKSTNEYRKRFRRLFGHLNRYAKPMDKATSIIMDEDDAFAICLRQLFAAHPFFKGIGPDRDSLRVNTKKGTNIAEGQPHFTNIETLYAMCEEMLCSSQRWNNWRITGDDPETFKRFRPDDETIDDMYEELSNIWTALVKILPDLNKSGVDMRNNNVTDVDSPTVQNHLLFRPIVQKPFARLVRHLLDQASDDLVDGKLSPKKIEEALKDLSSIPHDLGAAPWRNIVWQCRLKNGQATWGMPNENREPIANFIRTLSMAALSSDGGLNLDDYKASYLELVVEPANDPHFSKDDYWEEVKSALTIGV